MTSADLRELLRQGNSLSKVRAAAASGGLARILPTPFFDHVADVYARLERVCEVADCWPLKLAVLVHEEPLQRIPGLLDHCGCSDVEAIVCDVLGGFGALWKARDRSELEGYVRSHRDHLERLLLFELAHEGTATPPMVQAAQLAGPTIAREFAEWSVRLHG